VRLALKIRGVVQGVGFRPFVRKSALARGLSGTVANGRDGVRIEVQGDATDVEAFARTLTDEAPPAAQIRATERATLDEQDEDGFRILPSDTHAAIAPVLPPDLATCADCRREVLDPTARRHRYAFTNCTACGPRYAIARDLPYDRARTTMGSFVMCAACAHEYEDVEERRYHAQPIACAQCGPRLQWIDPSSADPPSEGEEALACAVAKLAAGGIVALRGLGGFQLLVDADDERAVARLRARKRRPEKPLAVLFADVEQVRQHAHVNDTEEELLRSPAAPIVLLRRSEHSPLAAAIGRVATLGAMLPTSPLHALITHDLGRPVVCTSGNPSGAPMCIDTDDAIAKLGDVADGFLTHDRPIARPLDDSVARVATSGVPLLLRRARGYAPGAVLELAGVEPGLALGAHMKSTVTLVHHDAFIPSQHIGDLGSLSMRERLATTADELCRFFAAEPRWIACDAHPEYASTRLAAKIAEERRLPLVRVQHHRAHVAACAAEHALGDRTILGLAWDGTGYGDDATLWGGEAFLGHATSLRRVATLRAFPLPGGERASREPRRAALGLLHAFAPARLSLALTAWPQADHAMLMSALDRGLNAPTSSSIGRLFDGVAALCGLFPRTSYEGQAAIALEELARTCDRWVGAYPLPIAGDVPLQLDTGALLGAVLEDLQRSVPEATIARRFHGALVMGAIAIAERGASLDIVLSGGCFQNQLLADDVVAALARRGHVVYLPRRVPVNDAGISFGQAFIASQRRKM
jgi:hydrogenase maturation protein HypF